MKPNLLEKTKLSLRILYQKLIVLISSSKTAKNILIYWVLFNAVMLISACLLVLNLYKSELGQLKASLLTQSRQSAQLVSDSITFNKYSLNTLKLLLNKANTTEQKLDILKQYSSYDPNTQYLAVVEKDGRVLISYPNGFTLPLNPKIYPSQIVYSTKECLKSPKYCIVPSYFYNAKELTHLDTLPLDKNTLLVKATPPILERISHQINLPYKSKTVGIIRDDGLMQANIPPKSIGKFQTGVLAKILKSSKEKFANYEGYSSVYKKDKIGAFCRIEGSNLTFFVSIAKSEFLYKFISSILLLILIAALGSVFSIIFLFWILNKIHTLEEEKRKYEKGIEYLAYNDILTHIPNRAFFEQRFSQMVASLNRDKRKMALAILDLDGFKKINDTLGHDMGDRVLKEVSKTLQLVLRKQDTLARLGGDEFAVLTDSFNSKKDLEKLSQRIIHHINNFLFTNNIELNLGISIGIAVANKPSTKETIFKSADNALYESKEKGKNTYTIVEVN